jgi:predicted AAA+ superfamily ATPase
VTTYLEEEVRAEAIVRNLGSFARFLELAASESGRPVNFRKLSQEIGVAHTTIMAYFDILEQCLIVERIEPLMKSSTRKKLTRAQKYLFFDLGVRRVAAREGPKPARETWGFLFEQFIGLELIRLSRNQPQRPSLAYWRDPDGPEVDWVYEKEGQFTPIEVKWSDSPQPKDGQHLETFLAEYENAKEGFVVCRTPRRFKLSPRVIALPWQELSTLV